MIYDKLADGIIRHSKAIVAIWVVIMIISVPLALKSSEVMKYDTTEMAEEGSESVKGLDIISKYFPSSQSDSSVMPVLVLHYTDETGMKNAEAYADYISQSDVFSKYTDAEGSQKLKAIVSLGAQGEGDDKMPGIVMAGIVYESSDINAIDDTPDLRAFLKDCLSGFVEEKLADGSAGFSQYVTGTPAMSYDAETGSAQDIQRIDPFTVLLILVLVGLFFRSFITSATPPITIGVAFVVVMALIFGIGQILNIFFITEMMLLVSMMGAGCDYCIFIIARYREELRSGKEHEAALHEAIKWAGESISISGASVIIGFGAMSICSFSLVSTMGMCLALGIVVALIAALTLIPSLLNLTKDRIFWPSTMKSFQEGGKSTKGWYAKCGKIGHAYFERSSRFSIKHAKAILVVTIAVSAPAAYIALTSETSYDMISSMSNGDSGEGMDLIGKYADQGMVMPDYTVIEFKEPIATVEVGELDPDTGLYQGTLAWSDSWKAGISSKIDALCDSAIEKDGGADANISYIYGPFMWDSAVAKAMGAGLTDPAQIVQYAVGTAHGTTQEYVGATIMIIKGKMMEQGMTEEQAYQAIASGMFSTTIDFVANCNGSLVGGDYAKDGKMAADSTGSVTYIKIVAATHEAAMAPRSMESIDAINAAVDDFVAQNGDAVSSTWVTGTAAVMYEISKSIGEEFNKIELLVVILIILLLFVVMRSYTIPIRSVATILMSICWTLAMTHILFTEVLHEDVMWLIPLILLVICLGLGMDYDILLTTRIREYVMDKGMSNDEAIHQAVVHSGSVITICGLIMGGAFGTLMLSNMVMMQQFGFALCFAIIADALIVRTYIVPAVMHLLGDWNWKGPGSKARRASKDAE